MLLAHSRLLFFFNNLHMTPSPDHSPLAMPPQNPVSSDEPCSNCTQHIYTLRGGQLQCHRCSQRLS